MSKFIKDQEAEETLPRLPEYTNADLRQFEKELEKYRYTNSRGVSLIDYEKYLRDQGALTETGAVIVRNFKMSKCFKHPDCFYPSCDITQYEILSDKIDKLLSLQFKTEFAKRMEIENLTLTANTSGL